MASLLLFVQLSLDAKINIEIGVTNNPVPKAECVYNFAYHLSSLSE